jgi:hypothetical protein
MRPLQGLRRAAHSANLFFSLNVSPEIPRLERDMEQKVPVQAMPQGSSFSLLARQKERCSSSSLRE